MKFNIVLSALLGLAAACGSDGESSSSVSSADDAKARAEELVAGSTAQKAESEGEGEEQLWKVEIKTKQGATLDVELGAEDGSLKAIEGEDAPFDYTFDPGMGLLTYEKARKAAEKTIKDPDEVVKWELSLGGESEAADEDEADGASDSEAGSPWEYEFYIKDKTGQLWEIKLDAKSGALRSDTKKDAVD